MDLSEWMTRALRDIVTGSAVAGLSAALIASCACPPSETQSTTTLLSQPEYERLVEQADAQGLLSWEDCKEVCGPAPAPLKEKVPNLWLSQCELTETAADEPALLCEFEYFCEAGRRPPGLVAASVSHGQVLGRWLGQCAHLEAAAVIAFEGLVHELQSRGAPARLVAQARRARDDEQRHARLMTQLARGQGVEPPGVVAPPVAWSHLEHLATDNAVEGCVHETWAALEMAWLATSAPEPQLRFVAGRIAPDEARHAALSWELHAWLRPQLSRAAERRVQEARDAAWLALFSREHPPEWITAIGLPGPAQRQRLQKGLLKALAA